MAAAVAEVLDCLDKVLVEPAAARHVLTPLPAAKVDPAVLEEVMRAEILVVLVVLTVAVAVVVVMVSRIQAVVVVEH
jgi:hypothetical protein